MTWRAWLAACATAVALVGISGCQRQEGPAERAGKQIDQAVEDVGRKVQEAGRSIEKAAEDAKK